MKEAVIALTVAFVAHKALLGAMAIYKTVATFIAVYQTSLSLATAAQVAFNGTLLANPIGLVIAAIAALIGITTTQAYRILTNAADLIGRNDVGTHTMRKTFGYHYYKRTKDVATLMEIFNHESQRTTLRYIGISEEEKENSLKDFRLF